MPDTTQSKKVYKTDNGDTLVIASGGVLRVEAGGIADIASGAAAVSDFSLATGSIVIGAAGVGSALDVKTSGQIIVGNGTTGVSVAVSGDATLDADGALTIANNAIENAMMADNSVDSAEIVAGAIDLAHMSANSVDSDQYVDGSIDLIHMSANSVDSDQYVDGSIDPEHLANNAVTPAKISADVLKSGRASYTRTASGAQSALIAAGSAGATRNAYIFVTIDATFADGDGTKPVFTIGETGSAAKFATINSGTAGDKVWYEGVLTAETDLFVTATAATGGTSTGGITVSVQAIRN